MGIPSYFSHIIRNYPNILRNLDFFMKNSVFGGFHHLFMDCNSIIYDAVHRIQTENESPENIEDEIIKCVIENIKKYIALIRPSQTVFIAFDGVAPFAKMEQQRTRRYKTRFMSNITTVNVKQGWNTSAITPGTDFMEKLSHHIEYAFLNKEVEYKVKKMIVSCSNHPGEGEHKLYEYMRVNEIKNDDVAVYGLDSDLIMLSIFHLKYCKNIYVFREAPEFLKSSIPLDTRANDNTPYFLDIYHLATSIITEMGCNSSDMNRAYDYVFMCFFLGNDFLPHFPAMNIRTHGIQALLDIYRIYIGAYPDRFFISKTSHKIQWKNVGIFVNEIAKREHEFLRNEYFVRNKFDKRNWVSTTDVEKEELIVSAPIIYRQQEKYICPEENGWEDRYYRTLCQFEKTPANIKKICMNYLEGLEWVYKYYTQSCPHWKWKYNYNYPPLFADLCKYIPHFETDFISSNKTESFSPQAQLAFVLPASNLNMLPKPIYNFLATNYSEYYPDSYDFQWAFCRYLWESHPLLPEIPLELLEQWDTQFRMHLHR